MPSTLEFLQRTKDQLLDESQGYVYREWTQCTCGHIYRAVNGHGADCDSDVQHPTGIYAEVMDEIVNALEVPSLLAKFKGFPPSITSADKLSIYTSEIMRAKACTYRDAALQLVCQAIEKIEAHEEAQRIKVIDEHTFGMPG